MHLSHVRSLAIFGDANKKILDLSVFKLLRVLDLEGTVDLKNNQLKVIGRLMLLRYLGLGGTDVTNLPRQIKALEHLMTLDIRQTSVKHLPEFSTMNLVSLLGDHVVIPRRMGTTNRLEELVTVVIGYSYSLNVVTKLVHKSKRLRVLGVRFDYAPGYDELRRFFAVVSSSTLQTLCLYGTSQLLDSLEGSPLHLQKFELSISDPVIKLPRKMYMYNLTHLHITICEVESSHLQILGNLPNLVLLHLTSLHTQERRIVTEQYGFCSLRMLFMICLDSRMGLQFGPRAMPYLQKFQLVLSAKETEDKYSDFNFGLQHLARLEQVSITINFSCASDSDVEVVEAAMKIQVSQIMNHPSLKITTAFDTNDQTKTCIKIFDKGELHVSHTEKEAQLSSQFHEIATIVMENTIDPETQRPYTVSMIEHLMNVINFAVDPRLTSKEQALNVIKLIKHLPLKQKHEQLREQFTAPKSTCAGLAEKVDEWIANVISKDESGRQLSLVCEIELSNLHPCEEQMKDMQERVEMLSVSTHAEGDSSIDQHDSVALSETVHTKESDAVAQISETMHKHRI